MAALMCCSDIYSSKSNDRECLKLCWEVGTTWASTIHGCRNSLEHKHGWYTYRKCHGAQNRWQIQEQKCTLK